MAELRAEVLTPAPLTVLGSFKEGKGSFMNLLHCLNTVEVELNRLENQVGYKDMELSEAQADVKALRLSERLREKVVDEISMQSSTSQMTMLRQGVAPRDTGKSTVSAVPESSAMPFKEQQLKQLRVQCLVFRPFRNVLAPKILHLEIALGTTFSREGD